MSGPKPGTTGLPALILCHLRAAHRWVATVEVRAWVNEDRTVVIRALRTLERAGLIEVDGGDVWNDPYRWKFLGNTPSSTQVPAAKVAS